MLYLVNYAQAAADATQFGKVINPIITNIVNPAVGLLFAVAIVVFVYGVFQMIINKTDAEAHSRGRWAMLGGIIGMLIMLSAWGIIHIVANTVVEVTR